MNECKHPKLTEVNNTTALEFDVGGFEGRKGTLIGGFHWKQYSCDECDNLITVLNAVVEKRE